MAVHIRAKGTAAVIAGLTFLAVIAAIMAFWIVVEIIIAVTLFNTGQGFLGWCMAGIVGGNILMCLVTLARSVR